MPSTPSFASGEPVPVALLTGFLGAGKTTLLNHVLDTCREHRFAVLVNELGRIGIDPALVTSAKDGVVELTNGCLCCSVRIDLARTLDRLLRRGGFEYLLIETTGIAEPAPIVQTFENIPEIRRAARIDAVIAVIDAEQFSAQLREHETARNQVALADFLVLNKIDLVSCELVSELERILRGLNPAAQILPAQNAKVDWRLLLDVGVFRLDDKLAVDPGLLDELRRWDHSGISSFSVEYEEPLDLGALHAFLQGAIRGETHLYRSKGIVDIAGEERRAVFHGVNNRIGITWGAPWGAGEPRCSKLVFIGRGLDEAALRSGLEECLLSGVRS